MTHIDTYTDTPTNVHRHAYVHVDQSIAVLTHL